MKDSPSKVDQIGVKVRTANDAVQSIKQLRKEIVEIMSQLLCLAKSKNPKGMLPLCNEMVTKTRSLLNIWEPSLVEEAFAFIEKHRIIDEAESATPLKMSPFRNITQQLGALDLKSPDLEDFATPMGPMPDLWPHITCNITPNNSTTNETIPNTENIDGNCNVTMITPIRQKRNKTSSARAVANEQINPNASDEIKFNLNARVTDNNNTSFSLPCDYAEAVNENSLTINETHFEVSSDTLSLPVQTNETNDIRTNNVPIQAKMLKRNLNDFDKTKSLDYCGTFVPENQLHESKNEILLNSNEFDENGRIRRNCSIALGHNGAFLDTKVSFFFEKLAKKRFFFLNFILQAMSSSPSANYYRPTEEPEPLDLTQLNIEASVMCLVSKVKFLCGRCGSPAVRLRQPKSCTRRGFNNIQSVSI